MAPEYPPCLIVFRARFEDGLLKGSVKYVEAEPGERLRVRWAVESRPEGFDEVRFDEDCSGVVFVYTKGSNVRLLPGSGDAVADSLGGSRYRWTDSVADADSWFMFALVLPEGYTLTEPRPRPAGIKIFEGRLALYWILTTDTRGRANVEWRVTERETPLEAEVERINRSYVSDTAGGTSTIFYVDEAIA